MHSIDSWLDRGGDIIDRLVIGAFAVAALVPAVILFVVAPWWAGVIGILLGVPVAVGLHSTLAS
jgi:hypothetical protein